MSAPILYMQIFSGPVRSVLLTAEALGLVLQKKIVDLSKKEHLTEKFIKLNPQHTIPTLDDNGLILWDSHAINAYLVNKYGKDDSLYPRDLAKRALVDQRLHFDNGMVFNWLRYITRSMKFQGRKTLTQDQIDGVTTAYEFLETFLNGHDWVTGKSLTIADFSLVSSVTTLDILFPIESSKFPNIIRWIKRAEALPYYHVNREGFEPFRKMF